MLTDIKKDFKQIKDKINEYQAQDDNTDFSKLLATKDVSDELKSVLVLLHTNYLNRIRELESHCNHNMARIVDTSIEAVELMKDEIEKRKMIEEQLSNNVATAPYNQSFNLFTAITNLDKLSKLCILIMFIIGVLTLGYEYVPDSLTSAVNTFKSLFGFNIIPADVHTTSEILTTGQE